MKKKVAFICVHNSCRSQIAEALGKRFMSDKYDFYSAGTETKPCINQDAVRLMKDLYLTYDEEALLRRIMETLSCIVPIMFLWIRMI